MPGHRFARNDISRYTWLFVAATVVLTLFAVGSYREISVMSWSLGGQLDTTAWLLDSTHVAPAREAPRPSYADVFAADADWRAANARTYTLAELRARGDGRRSAREAMQDRVFAATRARQNGRAIAELERWTRANPRDTDALLWLARLLSDAGHSDRSVALYRRALAMESTP